MATALATPSSRWTSYEGWDYDGLKERLAEFMSTIDKQAFIKHANQLLNKDTTISEPFSAGQYWACFELIAEDGQLLIVRARLPKHPNESDAVTAADESYAMICEASVMEFLSKNLPDVPSPHLYAYAGPGSELAAAAGCTYMILEGFYGNTLEDVQFDICQLPVSQQSHIISQWTAIQTKLAALVFPQIGSICGFSKPGEATLGKLCSASFEGLPHPGPFADAASYFSNIALGRLRSIRETIVNESSEHEDAASAEDREWTKLGIKVFLDIVQNTDLYNDDSSKGPFHFNHMDLGTQNIIVDDKFNFLAIIDWEFAQSAPWEINHYPMPFPLISSPAEEDMILADPQHIAYENVLKQTKARKLYRQGFMDAEHSLELAGHKLGNSIADIIESPASRIYGCFEKLGVFTGQAEALTYEMIRLAFGHSGRNLDQYLMIVRART